MESAAASPQAHEAEPPAQKEDAAKEAPARGEPIAERMAASPLFLFAQPPTGENAASHTPVGKEQNFSDPVEEAQAAECEATQRAEATPQLGLPARGEHQEPQQLSGGGSGHPGQGAGGLL